MYRCKSARRERLHTNLDATTPPRAGSRHSNNSLNVDHVSSKRCNRRVDFWAQIPSPASLLVMHSTHDLGMLTCRSFEGKDGKASVDPDDLIRLYWTGPFSLLQLGSRSRPAWKCTGVEYCRICPAAIIIFLLPVSSNLSFDEPLQVCTCV